MAGSTAAPRAFVTGASRGIGKRIAVALAAAGYDLALAARTLQRGEATHEHSQSVHRKDDRPLPGSLEETAELVAAEGRDTLLVRIDLTDPVTVEEGMGTILSEWGGLDLVVNNGRHIGPGLMDYIVDTPIEEYRKFVEAHAIAPLRIAQLVLPGMLERGHGTFITISSNEGVEGYPKNPPGAGGAGLGYRLGKSSGHPLAGSLLAEYGSRGIRAFNVLPGFTRTERNQLDAAELGFDPNLACPPEAIAAVVAWLATSPDADELLRTNIDGQKVAVERGLYPDWHAAPA
jgi:NAD(P)-dependent dehydrogenase (short-subunit alcohol dehydrogenase family)